MAKSISQPSAREETSMTNQIYLTPSANETLQSLNLSEEQATDLDIAINTLAQSIPQESRIVFADSTPSGGLRELQRKGWRIFFRYDPQQNAVMVADIRARTNASDTKAYSENELAAAS
jgi:mRNA-degrading endonuclease RelE of RelBE toxin-antitoxin system